MTSLVEVALTETDINNGGNSSDTCPVCLALERVLKSEIVARVGFRVVSFFNSQMKQIGYSTLPRNARRFIKSYQRYGAEGITYKQFAFDMTIPTSYLR